VGSNVRGSSWSVLQDFFYYYFAKDQFFSKRREQICELPVAVAFHVRLNKKSSLSLSAWSEDKTINICRFELNRLSY
jgi:hypothetical protein